MSRTSNNSLSAHMDVDPSIRLPPVLPMDPSLPILPPPPLNHPPVMPVLGDAADPPLAGDTRAKRGRKKGQSKGKGNKRSKNDDAVDDRKGEEEEEEGDDDDYESLTQDRRVTRSSSSFLSLTPDATPPYPTNTSSSSSSSSSGDSAFMVFQSILQSVNQTNQAILEVVKDQRRVMDTNINNNNTLNSDRPLLMISSEEGKNYLAASSHSYHPSFHPFLQNVVQRRITATNSWSPEFKDQERADGKQPLSGPLSHVYIKPVPFGIDLLAAPPTRSAFASYPNEMIDGAGTEGNDARALCRLIVSGEFVSLDLLVPSFKHDAQRQDFTANILRCLVTPEPPSFTAVDSKGKETKEVDRSFGNWACLMVRYIDAVAEFFPHQRPHLMDYFSAILHIAPYIGYNKVWSFDDSIRRTLSQSGYPISGLQSLTRTALNAFTAIRFAAVLAAAPAAAPVVASPPPSYGQAANPSRYGQRQDQQQTPRAGLRYEQQQTPARGNPPRKQPHGVCGC